MLNSHLSTRIFLVSERITLADIVVACSALFNSTFDAPSSRQIPERDSPFRDRHQPAELKDVFGEPAYVAKAVKYVPPARDKTKEDLEVWKRPYSNKDIRGPD